MVMEYIVITTCKDEDFEDAIRNGYRPTIQEKEVSNSPYRDTDLAFKTGTLGTHNPPTDPIGCCPSSSIWS